MEPRVEGTSFRALIDELTELFGRGVREPLPEEDFNALALGVFRHQLAHNAVYSRFCAGRGVTPDGVSDWSAIPPVPTRAFKHLTLLSAPEGEPLDAVYHTSGTSEPGARGRHPVPWLNLYRAAALPNFQAHLLPEASDGRPLDEPFRIAVLALLPSPQEAPDSSLSAMAGFVVDEWGTEESGWFVDPEEGLRREAFRRALEGAVSAADPVLLLGTAFSFVHWLDGGAPAAALPEGSRIMETGGFKGRSRSVPRQELYGALEDGLGVPGSRIVNEYGMTELLSQFYEPVLRRGEGGRGEDARVLSPPPWVRTAVLEPRTLEPLAEGERGLLCHLDLANAGSVVRVLTEDVGVRLGSGFRVLGRAEGAEPRGCSLAMEELMEVARGR